MLDKSKNESMKVNVNTINKAVLEKYEQGKEHFFDIDIKGENPYSASPQIKKIIVLTKHEFEVVFLFRHYDNTIYANYSSCKKTADVVPIVAVL